MLFNQIKNASQLKAFVEQGSHSHYFTRSSMRFFGDTMKNYGIIHHKDTPRGHIIELYRKRPVKCNNSASAYFVQEAAHSAKKVVLSDEEEKSLLAV